MGLPNRPATIRVLVAASLTLAFIIGSAGGSLAATAPAATSDLQSQIEKLVAHLPTSKAADYRRWNIIQLCLKLPQPGAIPSAAQSEAAQGYYFFKHATRASAAADFEKASDAYARASLMAPCVPDYYYDRAIALQQALKYGGSAQDAKDGAMSLHWYLTANPGDTQSDKDKINASIGKFEAEVGAKTDSEIGWVPLVWASNNIDVAAVRALLANGADANATYDFKYYKKVAALHAAASNPSSPDSLAIAKLLVSAGAKIDATDNFGSTPLSMAVSSGNVPVAQYLVNHGADVNYISNLNGGLSVLSVAAIYGNLNMVKFLISVGANVNLPNGKDDVTPIMQAIDNGHFTVAKYLISAGANINTPNTAGDTALAVAASYGQVNAVDFLLANHAKVDIADKDGLTALYYAASGNYLEVVKHLIAHGADVNWVSNHKNYHSILGIAALEGNLDVVKYLVHAGANVNLHENDGSTPLINAAQNDKPQIVQFLLAHHAKVDAADSEGMTALYWAAIFGYVNVARILVKYDADVNWASHDSNDDNVLGIAAWNGQLKMVKFLIAQGANVNAQMRDGQTPLDEADASNDKANMNDKMAVADYLSSHGGETGQAVDSGAMDVVSLGILLLILLLSGLEQLFILRRQTLLSRNYPYPALEQNS